MRGEDGGGVGHKAWKSLAPKLSSSSPIPVPLLCILSQQTLAFCGMRVAAALPCLCRAGPLLARCPRAAARPRRAFATQAIAMAATTALQAR
jgi:hypothetical protein